MKRNGESCELSNLMMDNIVAFMDDDIREKVHDELAPCTNEEFIKRYCELDADFESLLNSEFDIEL